MTLNELKKHFRKNKAMLNCCIEFSDDKDFIFSTYTDSITILSIIEGDSEEWMADIIMDFKEELKGKYFNLLFNNI
jgi:Fe-S cluster assembly iron-binding protein IscA